MKTKIFTIFLVFLAVTVCFVGCGPKGPKRVEISGKVTLDGEPVDQGTIKFEPVDGEIAPDGGKIEAGAYKVMVTTGQKKVHVKGTKIIGEFEPDPVLKPGVMANRLQDLPIPFDLTKEITVEKKGQVFDIEFTTEEIEDHRKGR